MMFGALALTLATLNPHATAAEEAFRRGDYEETYEQFKQAYAVEPDPAFLFAQGRALQEAGRFQDAIEAFERYLGTGPAPEQARKAYDRIQQCRAALPTTPQPQPEPPPQPEPAPEPVPAEPEEPVRPAPWHRDPLGGALLGTGLALFAGGGVLVGVGAQRRMTAEAQRDEGGFRQQLRSSNVLQGVGIGVAVGGGLLITGAVLRYMKVRRVSAQPGGVAFRF